MGEKINTYKTGAKIQKLKQNLSKEVVWVMKDNSFVNLIYFLSIENNFNNAFNTIYNLNDNKNITNSEKFFKSNSICAPNANQASINKVNSININNNTSGNINKNLENPQMRISKKIIKRKPENNTINGGAFNTENNIDLKINTNTNLKPNKVQNNLNNLNINKINNSKNISNNSYNNNNIKKQFTKIKLDQNKINNMNDKQILRKITNPLQTYDKNNPNNNNFRKDKINGTINNKENQKFFKENKPSIKNLNASDFFYNNSASPKKKIPPQYISINKLDLSLTMTHSGGTSGTSFLNTSDIMSISGNKNDKLNLTTYTADINPKEPKYKILSNNNNIKDINNIYSKDYISNLDFKEYEYDTFCQAIIKTGISENKLSLSQYSQNFPAQCGHELCTKLPALEPNILSFYQNLKKTNIIDAKKDAISHLIFPLGIKLCINQNYQYEELNNEPLINTIYNVKGDIYYIASLKYYRKISINNYNKIFKINPINVYNSLKLEELEKIEKKNGKNNTNDKNDKDNNKNNIDKIYQNKSNLNNAFTFNQNNFENKNNSVKTNKEENYYNSEINKIKDEIFKLRPNDFIYIPECLSLVSRFPYFNQLSKCLKIIINMRRQIINGDNNQQISNNISHFINHLINQVPIGNNKVNILFYTPISIEPITLYNPFSYNFGNFTCNNIFSILNIENIITIFLLVLLEQKIIFVDTSHIILSSISFFFINLIYPLSWVNTYQPLLSLSTIRYIQSITPFIMGGNENLILYAYYKKFIIYNENFDNIDKSNIVFVSLTNNLISCDCYNLICNKKGQSRKTILKYLGIPDLPKNIEKKLYNHLANIEKMDNINEMNEKLKTFFCRIMVFILDDYKDHYLNSLDKPIFNKENYLMCKKEEKKLFYKELLGTQLFTQFIYFENENYKSKKLCGKKLKKKKLTYGFVHDGICQDDTFFMKNKNKIEDLKIMIKKRRKEKMRKTLVSAKKFVKNIGQMFSSTTDSPKKVNKSVKKNIKTNLSIIKLKKERKKLDNILLMPYFIEEPNIELNDTEKYDYIQNKLNSIITLDNQLNQINNYKNKYIFDFNQKFDLKLIKDDNTRYFIGMLNKEENIDLNLLNSSANDINLNFNGINSLRVSRKRKSLLTNKIQNEEENKYIQSKEKINNWFSNIYLASQKKKLTNNIDITEDLHNERNRKYFSKLISQNCKTLFDIKENNQNFLNNESFMELLLKIKIILNNITYNEYETCKLLTLSCFKYFTILEEHKHTRFYLYNKYNDLYTPCQLWLDSIFWKTWFDEDVTYIEKKLNLSNENDYNSDLNKSNYEDNELYEYNEENNKYSIEYTLLLKINTAMNSLKLGEEFIKKVIYDDLASNYLTEEEINLFKEQYD